MKKFFGILLLVIGLFLLVGGVAALTNVSTRTDSFEGQVGETFSEEYRSNNDEQQIAGVAMIGGGILFIVLGIILVASKSNSQRKKEVELDVLKQMNSKDSKNNDTEKIELLSSKVKNLYAQKDYHSAIVVMKQLLELVPTDERRFIDLACLYSLTENLESYKALGKAIALGYNNFEKIKTTASLEWLRNQSDYEDFVKNGYKISETKTQRNNPHQEVQSKKETPINDDVIGKLEKLAELKEKGILSEEEFQEQKRRVLNG